MQETLEPGAATKAVAGRYGISTGLLFTWRKQMLTTAMAGFVPVRVAASGGTAALPPAAEPLAIAGAVASAAPLAGVIEVELPSGARIRLGSGADADLLRAVLAELAGR